MIVDMLRKLPKRSVMGIAHGDCGHACGHTQCKHPHHEEVLKHAFRDCSQPTR